jgi:hypothetical protein
MYYYITVYNILEKMTGRSGKAAEST